MVTALTCKVAKMNLWEKRQTTREILPPQKKMCNAWKIQKWQINKCQYAKSTNCHKKSSLNNFSTSGLTVKNTDNLVRMWPSSTALTQYAWSPGFNPNTKTQRNNDALPGYPWGINQQLISKQHNWKQASDFEVHTPFDLAITSSKLFCRGRQNKCTDIYILNNSTH